MHELGAMRRVGAAQAAPYSGAFGKAAASAICGFLLPEPAGRFLPPSPRCVIPERRASRLDKPPERSALV